MQKNNLKKRALITNQRLLITVVSLAVVVGLGSIWFFKNYDKVSRSDYTLTKKVRSNQYYTAQKYLNKIRSKDEGTATTNVDDEIENGYDNNHDNHDNHDDYTEEHTAYDEADSKELLYANTKTGIDILSFLSELHSIEQSKDSQKNSNAEHINKHPTVFIKHINDELTDAQYEQILTWVENGGHIVTSTQYGNGLVKLLKLQETADYTSYDNYVHEHLIVEPNDHEKFEELLSVELDRVGLKLPEEDDETARETEEVDGEGDKNKSSKRHSVNWEKHTDEVESALEVSEIYSIRRFIGNLFDSPAHNTLVNIKSDNSDNLWLIKQQESNLFNKAQRERYYDNFALAQPYDDYEAISAREIRKYFKQQMRLLKKDKAHGLITQNIESSSSNVQSQFDLKDFGDVDIGTVTDYILKLDDDFLISAFPDINYFLLDSSYGSGRITILSNSDALWSNPPQFAIEEFKENSKFTNKLVYFFGNEVNLSTADNAKMLEYITANSSEVWFLPSVNIDSLPKMLWKKHFIAVLGFFLLIAIWFWSLYNRFGKVKKLVNHQSYDITKYFQQIGRYGWELDSAHRLTTTSRTRVQLLINKRLNKSEGSSYKEKDIMQLQEVLLALLAKRLQAIESSIKRSDDARSLDTAKSSTNRVQENLHLQLLANKQQLITLLSYESLTAILYVKNSVEGITEYEFNQNLAQINAGDFCQQTQTLWLITWLLEKNSKV